MTPRARLEKVEKAIIDVRRRRPLRPGKPRLFNIFLDKLYCGEKTTKSELRTAIRALAGPDPVPCGPAVLRVCEAVFERGEPIPHASRTPSSDHAPTPRQSVEQIRPSRITTVELQRVNYRCLRDTMLGGAHWVAGQIFNDDSRIHGWPEPDAGDSAWEPFTTARECPEANDNRRRR